MDLGEPIRETATELAWAAGFFDGEGWVGIKKRKDARRSHLGVFIPQVDREVLDRFAMAVGVGKVYEPTKRPEGWKPQWRYVLHGEDAIRSVYKLLSPYLGSVKRRQFEEAFSAYENQPPRLVGPRVTHCHHGHPYDDENTYYAPSGGRRCRACHRKPFRNYASEAR